jgi:large subunit ribosomal protein L23
MKMTLLQPLITEKTMNLAAKGWYTFKVDKNNNKGSIAQAVQEQFKVHVVDVRTIVVKGKTHRAGKKRLLVSSGNWKKAMVQLKPKEKIDLFTVETPTKI